MQAATYYWVGGASGDWTTVTNWNTLPNPDAENPGENPATGHPTTGDNVYIRYDAEISIGAGDISVDGISLGSNGQTNGFTVTISGTGSLTVGNHAFSENVADVGIVTYRPTDTSAPAANTTSLILNCNVSASNLAIHSGGNVTISSGKTATIPTITIMAGSDATPTKLTVNGKLTSSTSITAADYSNQTITVGTTGVIEAGTITGHTGSVTNNGFIVTQTAAASGLITGSGITTTAAAGSFVWTGTTGTDWSTGSNWFGGTAPTAATASIVIPAVAAAKLPVISGTVTINTSNLTIDSGASIKVDGTLNLSGDFDLSSKINTDSSGTLTISGELSSSTDFSDSNLALSCETLAVTHNITCKSLSVTGAATVNSDSDITLQTSGTTALSFGGTLTKSGTGDLSITSGGAVTFTGAVTQPADTGNLSITSDGAITFSDSLTNAGSLTINSSDDVTFSAATQTATLTITATGKDVTFNDTFESSTSVSVSSANLSFDDTVNVKNITMSSTTTTASNMNVTGNWTNNGSFTASNGTVTFTTASSDDTVAQINGNNTFANIEIQRNVNIYGDNTVTNNFTANKKVPDDNKLMGGRNILFASGKTLTVGGVFDLQGKAQTSGNRLRLAGLNPDSATTPWTLNWTGSGTNTIKFVSLKGCTNNGNTILTEKSTDFGGNSGFIFPDQEYVWKGTASSAWSNINNWEPKSNPSKGSKIKIDPATNHPILTSTDDTNFNTTYNSTAYNGTITVSTGAIFDIAGQSLTLGKITNNGTVRLNGASGQSITGTIENESDSTVEYFDSTGSASFNSFTWDGGAAAGKQYENLKISMPITSTEQMDVAGTTTIVAGTGSTVSLDNSSNKFAGNVTIGDSSNSISAGQVTLNGTGNTGAIYLEENILADKLTLKSAVQGASLIFNTDVDMYTTAITTTGTQTYKKIVSVYEDATLSSSGDKIIFDTTSTLVNTAKELEISVPATKTISFEGEVGNSTTAFNSLKITRAQDTTFSQAPYITTFVDTQTSGNIIFDAGGTINTTGGQTFNTQGKVTLKGPINIGSTSPYLDLTHTAGETEINGTLNADNITLAKNSLNGTINATAITCGYGTPATATSISTASLKGTTINFKGTVSGTSLTINQSTSTTFDDTVTLATFADESSPAHTGSISFTKGGIISNATTLNTNNTVTIGDASANATLEVTGNFEHSAGSTVIYGKLKATAVTLAGLSGGGITIENSGLLSLNTTSPATSISCTSFTQNGTGSVSLGRNITTTNGAISFAKNITLTADSTLTANGSNGGITLTTNASVDGAHKLTLISDTNNITINSAIGSTTPLSEIELQGDGIINNNITTSGNQTYQGEVSGTAMSYKGAAITFASKLTSTTGKITIENSGVLSLATATPVSCTEFEQKGTGTVSLGRNITTTTGDITLTGTTTLSSNVELTASSPNQNVNIKSTISGSGNILTTVATNTNINSSANNTITTDSFIVSNNLIINNTGTSPANTTTIDAETTVNNSLTLTAGNLSIAAGKNISVKGDVTNSSAGTINGSGSLIFTGDAEQTFNTNGTSYTNIIENKSTTTGKLSINGDCSINSFTIQNGKETAFNNTPIITTFTDAGTAGSINFNNGGTINTSGGQTFNTEGKVTLKGAMNFGSNPSYLALTHTAGETEIDGTLNAANITLDSTHLNGTINGADIECGQTTVSTAAISGSDIHFTNTVSGTGASLTINQSTSTTFDDTVILSAFADDSAHTGSITFKKNSTITSIAGNTINTSGVVTIGDNLTTPATLTVGSNFTHNAQTIIYGTLNASGKDISLGLTTGGPVTLVGNNITLNDNLTSSSTITITNSGLFKTADGKAISYTGASATAAGFTQTNTSAGSSMLGGSFSGTGTASFTKHVYLYGNGAADFGSNGSEISIAENSNLIIARDSGTLSMQADKVTAHNIALYKGSVVLEGNIFSYKDIIILGGSSYSTIDSTTGYDNEYAYNTPRPAGWSTVQYSFESQFPDNTTAISTGTTNLTVDSGKIIHAGKNFYVNGSTLSGSSTWYIDILSNLNPSNCFAEAYNSTISNCTVRRYETGNTTDDSGDYAQIPTENCNLTNCHNFDNTPFEITDAYTVRDNSIYVEFNRAVRYHNTTLSYLKFHNASSSPVCSFENLYSQADCQSALNYDTQSSHFYIKAVEQNGAAVGGGAWNTDATGTSLGTGNQSCDRNGIHHDTIPSLDFPRAFGNTTTATISFIITDRWGKRLNNYSSRSNGTTYTSVADKTGPVLWTVRTGQELHDAYDTATGEASQHSYDSHNFLEFRYSEPVTFNSDSIPNNAENIQVTDSFGAIQENIATSSPQTLSFAGLAKISDSILYTGSQGSANKYINALYRNDDYSIRLSIAGWTDGTVTDYAGNEYKKWPGYIEAATQFKDKLVTSIADPITHENTFVKDMATTPNSQIEYPINPTEPVVKDNSTGLLETPSPDTYSPWDLSSPVFTPLRFSRETDWGDQAMSEAIGNTNGSGSTLDRIDFHFFDNTPAYDDTDSAEWFTEIGWCTPGSEASKSNLKASYSYAADIIGGARPFGSDANRTSGGIRFSTKADISPAFKYSTSANNPSPSTNFQTGIANLHTTVVSQLFTGSSAPMRPANDPDGLYLGLGLTDSSLSVETTFAFSYNDSLGYLTDLAGNRLRSKVSKTIDRTPPSFDAIISPVDTKSVYLLFVKQLVTDSSRIKFRDNSGTNVNITDSFATLMPKCFRIISIDASGTAVVSTENQIDTSIPAEVVESFSNDSFTCIKLTTTKEINIENLKNLYIQLITPAEYPQTASDPLTNNTGSRVTLIQDYLGNYMSMYSAHALSDFAVNYVNPLYAYSTDMLYEDQSIMNGLYEAGSWAVHDWNADQQNYGTLPAGYPISIVADTKGDEKIRVYLSPSPDADSVSKQFNSDFDAKFRIWLPALQDSLFRALSAANNTNFVYSDGQLLDTSSANSLFNITKETVSSWQSGSQISFMFGLMQNSNSPVRIYNNPYYDVSTDKFNLSLSIPVPLYCLRMPDTADLNTLDLWSFKIKGITAQRGGVTILNNVINASNDEKAVVIVDMPEDGNLTVCVMTLDGNIITYLNRGNTKAGEYYYTWNGKNKNGKSVARGMYFVRVLGGGIDETRKVMVVK